MRLILLLSIIILTGCTQLAVIQKTNGPTHGMIFTENKFPGEFNQSNDVKPVKKADGCITQILFIFMWGDAAAGSIALNNKIEKIATIDHSTFQVLGLFSRYCTIIRGE